MFKLEKSQYLNPISHLNYTRYEKTLSYKIVYYKKILKFKLPHFFITVIYLAIKFLSLYAYKNFVLNYLYRNVRGFRDTPLNKI